MRKETIHANTDLCHIKSAIIQTRETLDKDVRTSRSKGDYLDKRIHWTHKPEFFPCSGVKHADTFLEITHGALQFTLSYCFQRLMWHPVIRPIVLLLVY